jgi:hypothetical protein
MVGQCHPIPGVLQKCDGNVNFYSHFIHHPAIGHFPRIFAANQLVLPRLTGTFPAVNRNLFLITGLAGLILFLLAACCPDSLAADTATNTPARLVIIKAVYGDPDNADANADVTRQVAGAVKNDAVTIAVNNDNFEDMASGVSKRLKVDFTIDGIAGSKCGYENGVFKLSLKDKPDPAKKSGRLIIQKALYGDLPDGDSNDVTSEVARLVKDDTLTLTPNSDDFGDPAVGRSKKLEVDYTFDGVKKSKMGMEGQTLAISANGD